MTDIDPELVAANATGLKVHLRLVEVGGATYRVVSLRPATGVRYASNYFHQTWHIITGEAGAHLLARLLWGLAFQRQPGTLVMIAAPHLAPTPFEADPSDPIVIVPAGLTRFEPRDLALVVRNLPRAPTRTIRWHTFGMIAALAQPRTRVPRPASELARERMSRRAGLVCFTAPPALLREHALDLFRTRGGRYGSYHPLAVRGGGCWHYDGEIQLLPDFDDAAGAAVVARREVLGERAIGSETERQAIYDRRDVVASRRLAARRRPITTGRGRT